MRRSVDASGGAKIPMAEVVELEIPGPAGALPARLYVPHGAPPPPRPMLVYFHGGGWMVGDLETHDSACRFLAAHSGATILSPTYRLAPEHPFPAAGRRRSRGLDLGLASWPTSSAPTRHEDRGRRRLRRRQPRRRQWRSRCATRAAPRAAMQLLIYPATEAVEPRPSRSLFAEGFLLTQMDIDHCERAYLPDKSDGRSTHTPRSCAPPTSRDLPPAYVCTAGFDPIRDEGEQYAMRMREEGVKVALRRHPRLTHLFVNLTGDVAILPCGDAGDGRGTAHGPLALGRVARPLLVVQRLEHVEAGSATGGQDRGEDTGQDRDDREDDQRCRSAARSRSPGRRGPG